MATLSRGSNVNLTQEIPNLSGVIASVTWPTDLDSAVEDNLCVAAILLTDTGSAPSPEHVVFFNQAVSPDQSTAWVPPTGEGGQQVEIDLPVVAADITRIVLVAYINDGMGAKRTLGQVKRLNLRLLNLSGRGHIISSDNLAPDVAADSAATLGEVYRRNGGWKFKVIGEGFADGISGAFEKYGVN